MDTIEELNQFTHIGCALTCECHSGTYEASIFIDGEDVENPYYGRVPKGTYPGKPDKEIVMLGWHIMVDQNTTKFVSQLEKSRSHEIFERFKEARKYNLDCAGQREIHAVLLNTHCPVCGREHLHTLIVGASLVDNLICHAAVLMAFDNGFVDDYLAVYEYANL